jgi:hypothetical protein
VKIHALSEEWLAIAETLRGYGDQRGAALLERCASDLNGALTDSEQTDTLSLIESVRCSDYSACQLRRMVAQGVLENVGTARAMRFRRGDLPRKPAGKRLAARKAQAVKAVQELRRI